MVAKYEAEVIINEGYDGNRWTGRTVHGIQPLVIFERTITQCHGGIQLQYGCRSQRADGPHVIEKLFEYELVSNDEGIAAAKLLYETYAPAEKEETAE